MDHNDTKHDIEAIESVDVEKKAGNVHEDTAHRLATERVELTEEDVSHSPDSQTHQRDQIGESPIENWSRVWRLAVRAAVTLLSLQYCRLGD